VQPIVEHEPSDAVDYFLHVALQDFHYCGREETAHAVGVLAAHRWHHLDEDGNAVEDGLDLGDEQLGLGHVADHGGHATDGVVAGIGPAPRCVPRRR
jgi:hypothetical protein